MKKLLGVLALLLVLSLAACIYIGDRLSYESDKVKMHKTTILGDENAAEGIKLSLTTHYKNRLFWDTTFTAKGEESTRFRFYRNQQYEQTESSDGALSMGVHMEYGVNGDIYGGLSKVYRDLYDSIPAGGKASKEFALSEVYTYYPINIFITLKGDHLSWNSDMLYSADKTSLDFYRPYILKFNEFFKIPVLPEERMSISVSRSHNSVGVSGGSSGSDSFYMLSYSARGEDGIYFLFDAHTEGGNIVDTSLMPRGFGIYKLPISGAGSNERVHIEELSTVYKLSPEVNILDFEISQDKEHIYLITEQNGVCKITVISTQSLEAVQSIEVGKKSSEEAWYTSCFGDGYLAISLGWENLTVFKTLPGGILEEAFTVARDENREEAFHFTNWRVNTAFDGERFVIATSDGYRKGEITLSVYTENGLVYQGKYTTSLNVKPPDSKYTVSTHRNGYLEIAFE